MKQTYNRVKRIKLTNSQVRIERPTSWIRPWRNFMADVSIDGIVKSIEQQGEVLNLSEFRGRVYMPSQRNTDLELYDSKYEGTNPGGELLINNSEGHLYPAQQDEMPKWMKTPIGVVKDLAIMGGISALYVSASKGLEAMGMPNWNYDISLILSAGSYLGWKGKNIRSLVTSVVLAAGLTFGEEALGRDALGWEDLGKMIGLYPLGGLFGLGARQVKDYLTR